MKPHFWEYFHGAEIPARFACCFFLFSCLSSRLVLHRVWVPWELRGERERVPGGQLWEGFSFFSSRHSENMTIKSESVKWSLGKQCFLSFVPSQRKINATQFNIDLKRKPFSAQTDILKGVLEVRGGKTSNGRFLGRAKNISFSFCHAHFFGGVWKCLCSFSSREEETGP